MGRKAYNTLQRDAKKQLDDAVRRFAEKNPERFAELQVRAKHELEHPPERVITRHPRPSRVTFDVDEFIRQTHTQDYYIHTIDCWGDSHLYFESLDGETPEEVLTRRHPKFTERSEQVVKVEQCTCSLCS